MVFRGRWNQAYDAQIALAIARGTESRDRTVYATFDENCNELFRVLVNPRAYRGDQFSPQGVITAYPITPAMVGIGHEWRTESAGRQCPIVEPVNAPGYDQRS
ncbi:hypothetical protein BJF78_19185 [Pseudonocardia sp. CNS-139]|nr:hypothetical protein BJF78_19185 [Pseudonocardia sp. CNS-139]